MEFESTASLVGQDTVDDNGGYEQAPHMPEA
jgi:hypothetical protein